MAEISTSNNTLGSLGVGLAGRNSQKHKLEFGWNDEMSGGPVGTKIHLHFRGKYKTVIKVSIMTNLL